MTRNAKQKAATSPKAATSNANAEKPTGCRCAAQVQIPGFPSGDIAKARAEGARRVSSARPSRFSEALRACPSAGAGVHSWILSCANWAAIEGVSPGDAQRDILAAMTRPPSPRAEVGIALVKAYAEHRRGASFTPRTIAPAKPKPRPMTAAAFIARGDGATEADWFEASPVRIDWEPGPKDAAHLLRVLYRPWEFVFCGERYGGAEDVRTAAEWIAAFDDGRPVPPHFIPNPLTGKAHPLADGKLSRRGDSAVAGFLYAVAEFDGMDKASQLALWWGFRSAPIVALIDSGGKSIHAILRVDCETRADWERDIEGKLFPAVLCPLGCDPACRNESRLSRLPGHFRRERNAWQRLLYLNPEGTPRNECR